MPANHSEATDRAGPSGRGISIALIVLAQVLAMALWFSATAIVPALQREIALDPLLASMFTSAVQLGFVAGTLCSALLGLADRFDPRRFFLMSALIGAACNAAILAVPPDSFAVVLLRFATGACMAGVYPVGMKLVTTWARGDMGLLVGTLVGALTLGSASPHLFNALGGVDWRFTLAAGSVSATASAGLIYLCRVGPNLVTAPRFKARFALDAYARPSLRLANFGYLGHMWELYAMWAWIGVFLDASFRISLADPTDASHLAALATFATIGAGAIGCVGAGMLADRIGRTAVTILAMLLSGSCALLVGQFFGASPTWLIAVCIVWGITIVADSAQFSASIAELSPRDRVGTMLTIQTSVGFLLTLGTIHLIPPLVERVGWSHAFMVLALGPFLGALAMWRLRRHPDAARIAGGRR